MWLDRSAARKQFDLVSFYAQEASRHLNGLDFIWFDLTDVTDVSTAGSGWTAPTGQETLGVQSSRGYWSLGGVQSSGPRISMGTQSRWHQIFVEVLSKGCVARKLFTAQKAGAKGMPGCCSQPQVKSWIGSAHGLGLTYKVESAYGLFWGLTTHKNGLGVGMHTLQEQDRAGLPDRRVFLLPDRSVLLLPNRSVLLLPDMSVSLLPDRSVSLLPDRSVSLLPDRSVLLLPDRSVLLLPDKSVLSERH
eukprot:1150399-Pelagomonas_calceolata.AAC.2